MSDRILGALLFALAVWYGWQSRAFDAGFADPVGPAAFPGLLAWPFALFSLALVIRPASDPHWARGVYLVKQGVSLVVLFAFPFMIEWIGFPAATIVATALLALILNADPVKAVVAAVGLGAGLYVLFDVLLGLPLPLVPKWTGLSL